MANLLTVDPGKQGLGWAIFDMGTKALLEAGLVEVDKFYKLVEALGPVITRTQPTAAVIEIPQVYQQSHWRGDPNDLIKVATIAGVVVGMVAPYVEAQLVVPHAWKGSRPKDVDIKYTRSKLSDKELLILKSCGASKGKLHNVLDAVGIGLWRLERRR